MTSVADTSVKKSVTVNASVEHAFAVFTAEFDTWWPRSHHIGKSPMKQAIIETRAGGRCYTTQEDGAECDWGRKSPCPTRHARGAIMGALPALPAMLNAYGGSILTILSRSAGAETWQKQASMPGAIR